MSVHGRRLRQLPARAAEPFLQAIIAIIQQFVRFLLGLFFGSDLVQTF